MAKKKLHIVTREAQVVFELNPLKKFAQRLHNLGHKSWETSELLREEDPCLSQPKILQLTNYMRDLENDERDRKEKPQ